MDVYLLCFEAFVLSLLYYIIPDVIGLYMIDLFTHNFQGCLLALGQSFKCPIASELSLESMGIIGWPDYNLKF